MKKVQAWTEEIESLSVAVLKKVSMASDRMWGGLPFMVPSKTAMKYLHHAKVIPEEDVPVGAHYRAREDMLQNVRLSHYQVNYIWPLNTKDLKVTFWKDFIMYKVCMCILFLMYFAYIAIYNLQKLPPFYLLTLQMLGHCFCSTWNAFLREFCSNGKPSWSYQYFNRELAIHSLNF